MKIESEIPKFIGEFGEFRPFFDEIEDFHFSDQNPGIADREKFYVLKSCLEGIPGEIIKGLDATTDGYLQAVQVQQPDDGDPATISRISGRPIETIFHQLNEK